MAMLNSNTLERSNVKRQNELTWLLNEARERTLQLISTLSDEDLYAQHSSLMSPIAWDLGHIGNFEELWGVRALPDSHEVAPELDELYDATKNPRSTRHTLPLPSRDELKQYLQRIRDAVLERLNRADLSEISDPLLRDGFVHTMLAQHEYQHNETILQTLQLKKGEGYRPGFESLKLPAGSDVGGMVTIQAGDFVMGTNRLLGAYDNERFQHVRSLNAYRIGSAPVTNGEYLRFVMEDGYKRREFWDDEGWQFIKEDEIIAPKYWTQDEEGGWTTRYLDYTEKLNLRRPVMHVCWYEAQAYCRFVGKRLPTEAEWERAAAWDSQANRALLFPWGDEEWGSTKANLDQHGMMPAEIGAYPEGVSPSGCHQMLGDVWEWTSSNFEAYPSFQAFPYDEYSKIFFGSDYKVLRGGSWATRPGAISNTFRNWDYPIRRQIFSGFRLAESL